MDIRMDDINLLNVLSGRNWKEFYVDGKKYSSNEYDINIDELVEGQTSYEINIDLGIYIRISYKGKNNCIKNYFGYLSGYTKNKDDSVVVRFNNICNKTHNEPNYELGCGYAKYIIE